MASITFDELVNEGQTNWEGLLERVGDGPAWAPLEKGDYAVEIVDVEVESNSRVLGQWSVKMRVTEGPERGHPVWARVVLDGYNKNKTAVFFRISNCLGIPLAFYDDKPSTAEVAAEMVGRRAIVTVHPHLVEGTETVRVAGFAPAA